MFSIIYADPPWAYRDKCDAGKRGASHKYQTMNVADIGKLDVAAHAARDCALFCWATMPTLPDAFTLIKAWGFEYKTVSFTWVKRTKNEKDAFGMGNWTRANAELLLIATRGRPKRINAGIRQVQYAQIGRHSEKPDLFRGLIVELMGALPRVELFAREKRHGWAAWGNEIESDIEIRMK